MSSRNSAPDEVTLRVASPADAEILTSLHAQAFPHYWDAEAFTGFFSVAGTQALLADIAGKAVAMMVFRVIHEQAEIITLAVAPPWRRRGLAERLLAQALEKSRQQGAVQMFLDVEDGNNPALNLYKKHGFDIVNRRRLYYRQTNGSYTDALVMTRKLG